MISNNIFKKYDIRGIYPDEINKDVAFKIGAALVIFFSRRFKKDEEKIKIIVGQDARLSSPILFKELVRGINSQKGLVVDLGMVSSDVLCFALNYFDYDGGVMVTASHNPKQYNGFKIFLDQTIPVYWENGLMDVKELAINKQLIKGFFKKIRIRKKIVEQKNIISTYVKYLLDNFKEKKEQIDLLRVVVDAGNGVGGLVINELAKKIPIKLFALNFNPNGNFPKRDPNPKKEGALKKLKEKVIENKADFGMAFDGDGDRVIFVDEKGEIISPCSIIALFSKKYLLEKQDQKIVYTGNCSKIIPEIITKYKGKPIRSITGYPFVRENMRHNEAVLGGEISGHLFFKELFYNESGGQALLMMLEILSETNESLSELIAEFKKYFLVEKNFKIKEREKIIEKLVDFYSKEKKYQEDGLTVENKDWWFNARLSNTEPVLRITLEAVDEKKAQEKLEQISKILLAEN